jgi:hypothetical protein
MKARPRRIENRVAQELTALTGFAFERVPVIGRKGPDLTFPNPWMLAIDVKSRKEVPIMLFKIVDEPVYMGTMGFYATPLSKVGKIEERVVYYNSRLVRGYMEHMWEWADQHKAWPVVVLHRPGMKVRDSILVATYEGFQGLVTARMPSGKEEAGGKDGG